MTWTFGDDIWALSLTMTGDIKSCALPRPSLSQPKRPTKCNIITVKMEGHLQEISEPHITTTPSTKAPCARLKSALEFFPEKRNFS